MKFSSIIIFSTLVFASLLIGSCGNLQSQNSKSSLSPSAFSEKIKQTPEAALVDVRTPEEFENGHLERAKNIDWNGADFDSQISALDKSKPIFVYCLSGGRSSSAANKMRSEGFKEVYELNGGIMKWRAANLPEIKGTSKSSSGMTQEQFSAVLLSDKLVLIDFYAEWCAPCKKMKPYLEEIAAEKKEKVVVIRIDADANPTICKTLKVDALPVLQLYKNKKLIWSNSGFVEKMVVEKQIEIVD